MIAHGLHSEHADIVPHQHGQHVLFEAVEVRVPDVQWHLHGIEPKLMALRGREHFQVDGGTLGARKADVADLPGLLRIERRFHGAGGREDAVTGFEAAQRFLDLLRRGLLVAAIDLRHQERALPIAIAQR